LNRFMERPSKVCVRVAAAFGLLSVAGPFTFPEATLGTKLALTAMHLILTAAIVGAMVRPWTHTAQRAVTTARRWW
jgi:hypothetical protein